MGNIKVRDENGKWVVVATDRSSGIVVDNPKLSETPAPVDDVMENHEDRISKLERNVSWLAKHGGGGGGGTGGGTGPSITEATCRITVNGSDTGAGIIVNEDGINIMLNDISVQATKAWKIVVRIGSQQVASTSASFTVPSVNIAFANISPALINHVGNMYVSASYEDELNGIYGAASWSGTVTESVVNISAEDLDVGLTDEGDLETDASIVYTYSVGIVGDYIAKIDVSKDGTPVTSKQLPVTIIDTNINTVSVRVKDLLPTLNVGVYTISAQLFYKDNIQIQNSIVTSLTLVSKQILISTTKLSEDINSPVEVSLSGSMNLVWTAYLQGSSTFQYNYKIGTEVIKSDTIGYFGTPVNDYISVNNKSWAVENKTVGVTITVSSGSDVATKTYYIKFIKSKDTFLSRSTVCQGHLLTEFLARSYNNGDQAFVTNNRDYLVGGSKTNISAEINMFNMSNLVGIKSSTVNAPYLRISNGARAELNNFKINNSARTFSSIISAVNNDFTISISFKADYHPDDDRTILACGQLDTQTGHLITGFEIDVHDIYVNTSSLLRLTDNTVNNIDIVCLHSDDNYVDSEGNLKKERHYIIKIYLEGALSAVTNVSNFPTISDIIYLGGKVYGDEQEGGWLCDCNIYNLQIYDYALNDFDIVTNYINNRVASTYKNNEFDFTIIDTELRKNFCERDASGGVVSYLYQNGSYSIDFLLDGQNLSEDKLNQYAKAVGIPVMLIDVSNDDSWTFENFVNQQTADNVQLQPTSGKTISYWDPTQQNTSVLKVKDAIIELQGTSTLQDAVKNINITVPNSTVFVPKDTWLPEQTYTLKADVVDSSHSNNASIGKFINTVLKDYFPSNPIAVANVEESEYVKNQQPTATLKHTVEGFPILLVINFHTTETSKVSTTPLGIYSFNLGRDAFRNLGFRKVSKITDSAGQSINVNTFPYLAEDCTYTEVDSDANWIEIKDTTSLADFAKLTGSSLPANFNSAAGDFWQNDNTILNQRYEVRYPQGRQAADYTSFKNFVGTVMSLPIEGLHTTIDRIGNVDRPEITTEYDLYRYQNGYIKTGQKQQIITDVNQLAALGFNTTSIFKYFVIANFFGLADNFGKNSTYRSWENGDYYIGFYDLDTALGGGNQGTLSIEPNMWMKYLKNTLLEGKNYGFLAETFNSEDPQRLSNTVFSANHNKLWLSMDTNLMRNKIGIAEISGTSAYSYYWDDFRENMYRFAKAAGYDDICEYFVNEFYLKQTGECGPLLFNLDYKLKYLVQFTDDKYSNTKHLSKLHGRKAAYTLDWLKKHVLFLDSVFYWRNTSQKFAYPNDINCKMSSTVYNTPEYIPVKSNSDVIVYHNVGDATKTYYYLPKNTEIFLDAGGNNSNSEVTWGITNSPQIIQIGNTDNPLSVMNTYKISHTNTELHINNPGLPAITELKLQNSNSLAAPFSLDSFQPEIGVSEIRVLNFSNTQSRLIQGARPTFTLELVKQLAGGQTDTKFTKLREIDISNSQCVSDITIPSVPLKLLSVYNSSLTNLNLDNQNYIESINLQGCTKLITITIKECASYKSLDVSNLNNLQEVNILNNANISNIRINNCSNLQKVTIQNNANLKSITITSCNKLTGDTTSNYLTITDNTSLTSINLSNCTKLATFTISNSNQNNIGTLNLGNTSVTRLLGGSNQSFLDLREFTNCDGVNLAGNTKVVKVHFANNKSRPITITGSFQNCALLERIYGNVILCPVNSTLGAGMFRNCSKFQIHGDDYKCLGPNTWNGKSVFDSAKRVKTMWELITNNSTNRPSSGTTRPYASVTWDQSFVAGNLVTNIKFGNNNFSYLFYGTHVTQFDVYYFLFVVATTMTTNYQLTQTFYNLVRDEDERHLFHWGTTDNNIANRFTFYRCDKLTYIAELFRTGATTYILSPEDDYPINDDEDNGVFSPLINVTVFLRLTSNAISCSNKVFRRTTGNYKVTNVSYQIFQDLVPTDENYQRYNYLTNRNNSVLGDFTGFFNNLINLSNISNIFSFQNINFDTIKIPIGVSKCAASFNATYAGTGTIDLKKIFEGCNNLQYITYSFATTTVDAYGPQAEFPITSDMFRSFPKLIQFGYNPSNTNEGSTSNYTAKGARHYINQDEFPDDILANNPNITTCACLFRDCENKQFATDVEFPGSMFLNNTKLTTITAFMYNAKFSIKLTSNGFRNCPNLANVPYILQGAVNVHGEIPYKFLYHGHTTVSKTVYGTNQEEKPDENFDMSTLQSATIQSISVRNTISWMDGMFYGCKKLTYYENAENQDFIENNPDYSPFKWNYNKASGIWTENTETKQKIAYWGYTGQPNTQNSEYKYLEGTDISLVDVGGVPNKVETLNYMCPPDLFRYCTANCSANNIFNSCGYSNYQTNGGDMIGENWQTTGITGRIVPYLLKPIPNTQNISAIFKYCRRLSSYKQDGVVYQIPKDFFSYATGITTLTEAFMGLDFCNGTNLDVFTLLKNSLDVRKIFCYCRYFTSIDGQKQIVSNIFKNNNIIKLTGAFSEYNITLNGDYYGSVLQYWYIKNTGKVSFANNFEQSKVPGQQYIYFVYKGVGTDNANDATIPNINENY